MAVRSLALCAGIGGLDLGVADACRELGLGYRLVGVVERQAHPAAVLVARMADASLDTAPIGDDLSTFDARPWAGAVDLVTAGFPCQPVSVAGKRMGEADDRRLWPHVLRVVRDVRPRLVFLENVPGLLSKGIDRVLGDLAEIGFDAEWDCVPAAAVGAPHRRDRLFILARTDAPHPECNELREQPDGLTGGGSTTVVGDSGRTGSATNADGSGSQGGRGPREVGEPGGRGRNFWEETPAPEPTVRRVDDGTADWVEFSTAAQWADRIHALGNAVVRQAASRAFVTLYRRLNEASGGFQC